MSRLHDYFGEKLTMKEISERTGCSVGTIRYRMLEYGLSPQIAATMTKSELAQLSGAGSSEGLRSWMKTGDCRAVAAKRICTAFGFADPRDFNFERDESGFAFTTDHIAFRISFDGSVATCTGRWIANDNLFVRRVYAVSHTGQITEVAYG